MSNTLKDNPDWDSMKVKKVQRKALKVLHSDLDFDYFRSTQQL